MKRVSDPVQPLVTLQDAKDQLRVLHDDEDMLIQGLVDAASSWMDGWDGILGRCIFPQSWERSAEDIRCGLTMPDIVETVKNDDGTETITCAMPASKLPSIQMAAKLIVGHWYEHRAAVGEGLEAQPLAVRSLIEPLRHW